MIGVPGSGRSETHSPMTRRIRCASRTGTWSIREEPPAVIPTLTIVRNV